MEEKNRWRKVVEKKKYGDYSDGKLQITAMGNCKLLQWNDKVERYDIHILGTNSPIKVKRR